MIDMYISIYTERERAREREREKGTTGRCRGGHHPEERERELAQDSTQG
jgi:hypothetical protein